LWIFGKNTGTAGAPEHFQKRMTAILDGLPGVVCQMNDVLIFRSTQAEHNTAFKRIHKAGATLNREKCEFS
jgi:hypothetical protein